MYAIFYTKTAQKDIPKLKMAHLDSKAKELIDIIRQNPYKTQSFPCGRTMSGNSTGTHADLFGM